jgi:hypothetical protein
VIALHLADVFHQLGRTSEALPYWKSVLQKANDYPGEFSIERMAEIQQHIQQAESSG